MSKVYEVRYYCVACGHRWAVETANKLVHTTHRKCKSCRQERAKVCYLGPKTGMHVQGGEDHSQ